jgi:hypothetical protein
LINRSYSNLPGCSTFGSALLSNNFYPHLCCLASM